MTLDRPRVLPDHDGMDDMSDFALEHPEINRNLKDEGEEE